MTVAVQTGFNSYYGNAATVNFAFTFKVLAASDLGVYVAGVRQTLNADYSVSGAGSDSGGTVTFVTPPGNTFLVSLIREMSVTRSTDYQQTGDFNADTVNPDFDRAILLLQDVHTQLGRTLRLPADEVGVMPELPARADRVGMYGAYDALGDPIASAGTGADAGLRTDLASTLMSNDGSRLIGYRRESTGGVARSLAQILERTLHVEDFGTNTTPSSSDMQVAFQAAIDAADSSQPKVRFTHQNAIGKPLLIRSTSVQNLALEGDARTISIIEPTAIDIKQAAQNVNCLIFNQCDNGHLHLAHLRFFSDVAYTGIILYCIEGGGADASGQALYSAVFDDIWCSLSSQNTGYMRGGFSNLKANNMVYESVKDACWILEGNGNGDLTFVNHQLFICFDSFIRGSDASQKTVVNVICVHAYNHLRGRLIVLNNAQKVILDDIIMEPDAANLGDCGLFKLTGCSGIQATNFSMAINAGVPIGALGIEIIGACAGKFVNGTINATVGLSFSGAGVVDLEFINVDFSTCTHCLELTSGTQSGRVRFTRCKFNDAQIRNFVHLGGTPTIDWEFSFCEFLNAGLGGNPASRNINLTLTGGSVTFFRCRIGQNNVGAVANYYISNGSAIIPKFIDCEFVGTPPLGITDAVLANMPLFRVRDEIGASVASAANITLPFDGNKVTVTGAVGITSITALGYKGNEYTLYIPGNLTVTDGSNLKLAGNFVSGANGGAIKLLNLDNTNWLEVSRAVH